MFARIAECHIRPGRSQELAKRVKDEVVPALDKHPGFVDLLALSDRTSPDHFQCISLWISREDALQYHEQHYDTITNLLEPLLDSPLVLKTSDVITSTAHRLAGSRAA